jgi:nucleoside-diphosphate-sugar epimerase
MGRARLFAPFKLGDYHCHSGPTRYRVRAMPAGLIHMTKGATMTDDVLRPYLGQRVLITGGASFIGSHLAELLVGSGAEVRIADDLSSGRLDNLSSISGDCDIRVGDVRHEDFATASCKGVDTVFHLAASHGGRGYIETHPIECCNNLLLDHVLLVACASSGVEKVVHASSACVYPIVLQDDASDRALLAEDQCNFDEPGKAFADGEYGWAKLMGELQLRAFHKQFGIDGIACRIFTAYGERENESHAVVALIAKALARMDPYPIWGDGTQTRNFTYVSDTVKGLALAGASMSGFDVINVGSPVHTTVNDLVNQIFEATDFVPKAIDYQLEMPVGAKSRAADCTKSERLFRWYPGTPITDGVPRTVNWYRSTGRSERLEQLERYLITR